MVRSFFAFLFFLFAGIFTLSAQSYRTLWHEVNVAVDEGKPQTAIAAAQRLFQKAHEEQNTPYMMQGYLAAMPHRMHLSVDSLYVDIEKLEQWASAPTTSVSDAAVLHSLLGSIYAHSARGSYDNKVVKELPADMSQWTRLMYHQRAFDHFTASVNRLEELCAHSTDTYSPIVFFGHWSSYYNHDLMHLIGRRAAFGINGLRDNLGMAYQQADWADFSLDYEQFKNDTLKSVSEYDCPTQVMRIFQRMQALINPEKQEGGWILMELNRMNIIPLSMRDKDEHLRQLNKLKEQFNDNDLCGCVCLDIATLYRSKGKNREALAALREGIEKYPSYEGINFLRNLEKQILQPSFRMNIFHNRLYPGNHADMRVDYRNLDEFTVWLRKVDAPLDTLYKYQNQAEKLKRYSKFHGDQRFALTPDKEYQLRDTIVHITLPQEPGAYLMEAIADHVGSNLSLFYVLPYKLVSHNLSEETVEYAVLDAKSGKPVADAVVQLAGYDQSKEAIVSIKSARTDKYGNATLPNREAKANLIRVRTATDNSMPYIPHSYFLSRNLGEEGKTLVTNLFADRTHFRPGQTVYVKGISYWQHPGDSLQVGDGEVMDVSLKDPMGQVVEKKSVRNNEFGSFSTEFVLPTESLNGRYRIETSHGDMRRSYSLYIQVEEYKLPTFEVTFDTVKTAYAIGDTVTLTGRAMTYSGVPVADAEVDYHINMDCFGFLRGWEHQWSDWKSINGETITDSDGRFSIKVFLEKGNQPDDLCWWRNEYQIFGTVTSATGESHQTRTSLWLRSCPLDMTLQGPDLPVIKGKPHPLTFAVTNLNGEPINTKVDYRIYQCDENWKSGELVYEGQTMANQPQSLEFLDQRPSSYYIVKATTALEGKKDSVRSTAIFCLYAENETKVPLGTVEWFNWLEREVAVGEPARLQFGTREKEAYIQMDVFSEKNHIESRHFVLSDTVQTFTFDYLPEYGRYMFVSVMYVKDGTVHTYSTRLDKKQPDKNLKLKWQTFRDKLTPGAQEEWTLTVNRPDGTPADAELLASMYDASLEQLGSQEKWYFRLRQSYPVDYRGQWHGYITIRPSATIDFELVTLKIPSQYRYDDVVQRFYKFDLPFLRKSAVSQENGVRLEEVDLSLAGRVAGANVKSSQLVGSSHEEETFFMLQDADIVSDNEESVAGPLSREMMLRENFTETAFFHPHLRTDSAGRVKISFTLPDNLTRWHFRALAHTKQMDSGTLEDFATVQREFMVQPNLPRFVRAGDETTIRAVISNLSEKAVKGTARMELIDPLTEKVVLSRKAKFNTQAGETCTVSFAFSIDDTDVPLPICRIVADGGRFSDGEQRYLPVLANKVWMTESTPLVVNGPGTVTEPLTHLFNHHSRTATNHRLTVELTGNPIWTAIQALPTVATPTTEDVFAWTTAWYAHSVASHIAQSSPQIKAVIDQWKADGADNESLWSNLQKNQELKTLLLTETPWVTDAADEASQKRRLALLFDRNYTDTHIALCLNKMQDLQNSDGGWSWYKGMPSNSYVTSCILELMERVIYLTGSELNESSRQMMASASEYLDRELLTEYRRMLEQEKAGEEARPSARVIRYLSSLALNGRPLGKDIQKAVDYMAECLTKQLNALSPYGKAKASIILKHCGKYADSELFTVSLKEYTTYTPQMGRYFDTPQSYENWRDYRLPTQVAVIEAWTLAGMDDLYIEQMKQWLLMQKQAQCWDHPLNTVDAIHALLMNAGKGRFDKLMTGQTTSLKIDGKPVASAIAPMVGMDYQKRTYTTGELKKLPREATLEKQTPGLAWGAVYAQYLEDMDKTASTYTGHTATAYGKTLDQPLSIERTWLVQRQATDNGQHMADSYVGQTVSPEWIPLTEGMVLHVGDKVMSQLTIRADRAMDFVQVKEGRAACAEPHSTASGYRFKNGLGYYCSVKDAATLYFIDYLPKGTYTLQQTFYIDRTGRYQAGPATVQCAYSPEFVGHTAGAVLRVE